MNDRSQLLEELRVLVKDGATPSRLLHAIFARLGDTVSYGDLCGILEDAFNLPVARLCPASVAPKKDFRGVVLNKTLLMEVVWRRHSWDPCHAHNSHAQSSWMDDLVLESPEDIGKRVRSGPIPGLSQASWSALTLEEQETLHIQLASALIVSQRVEVLSRLVERLQEKLLNHQASKSETPSGAT